MQLRLQVYLVGSHEAVAYYRRAFGAELGYQGMNADGTFMHAEIVKDGQTILALSEAKARSVAGMNMQFGIHFGKGNGEALKTAYEVLSEGGRVLYPLGPCPWSECMAEVIDRYGVLWYIAL